MILLLLLVLVLGGIGAYYWSESTRLIRQELTVRLQEWAPDARILVGECAFDWYGHVHLDGFSITLPEDASPLIDLPETIVEVDRDALIQRQRFEIETVRLVRPALDLVRNSDGTWNWQKLPPFPRSDGRRSLPNCVLEQAQLRLRIAQPTGQSSETILLENANLNLIPDGKRSFLIKGRTRIDRVGFLKIDGRLNVDTRTGTLAGNLTGVRVGRDLLALVSSFEPQISQEVVRLEEQLRDQMFRPADPKSKLPFTITGLALRESRQPEFQPAVSTNTPVEVRRASAGVRARPYGHRIPVEWIGNQNSILGLLADLDLEFQIRHLSPETDPELKMLMTLTGGEVSNTALPFPLVDLNGQIEYSENSITLREITAKNGPTVVYVNGQLARTGDVTRGRVDLKIENLDCDERLRSRLSAGFSRIYDMHHPKGYLDLSLSLVGTDDGKWAPRDVVVSAKKCSVMHDVFPYPVRDAVGSIRQEGADLKIDMLGYAGHRPITLSGYVRNPGPEAHVVFEIDVKKLPLDQQFFDACNPELQKILTTMGLTGLVDAHWKFERQSGPGQRMKPQLRGTLHAGSMSYRAFPYRVDELSGKIEFDGSDWVFRDLKGIHGDAQLTAEGRYTKSHGAGDLQLTVTTENASIDQSLYRALPENLKEMWQQFSPSGTIEKSITRVNWIEGQPALISLPEIRIREGEILCRQFPYGLEGIRAEYSYMPANSESPSGWLTIKSFSGRHDSARLTGNGYVEIGETGDWRFHLSDWTAEKLVPDQSLLHACGPGLRDVIAVFDPRQPLNISGELELRGTSNPEDPITAGWYTELDLSGSRVTLGLDLSDVHGRVTSAGKWDGFEAQADGELQLSTLTIHETKRFRLHDIRGPFKMRQGMLVAGNDSVIERPSKAAVDKNAQVTARLLGGELALNVAVDFQNVPEYRLSVDLEGGRLEQFAQLYMRSRERLRGTINGWVTLKGQGDSTENMTGRGQIQISPAELYKLPVIFQVLSQLHTLNPKSPDAAAFNYALARFGIQNERFEFQAIDLVGSQIQLQGRGVATFDGRLGLTFASILQRSMVRRPQVWIPIVTEAAGFFSGVTDLVGVAVEVTGTTDNPKTRIIPGRNIDQALRSFFDSIRPLPLTPPPYAPVARPPAMIRPR